MDLIPYESLMRKLRDKRRDVGLQQKTVASGAGISKAQLSRMERGKADAKYSTVYAVWEYLREQENGNRATAADLMHPEIEWASVDETVRDARYRMLDNAYSQLPVRDSSGGHVGSVTDRGLMEIDDLDRPVGEVMGPKFIEVTPETSKEAVLELFRDRKEAILVRDDDEYIGIITTADVI